MANVTTNDRFWQLDTAAVIVAVGTPVIVRKLVFAPAAIDDDVVIQEYLSADATLDEAIILRANHSDVNLVSLDFGPDGRQLNGFKLSTIDAGTLYVYLGKN
jgi:hypothetical protein